MDELNLDPRELGQETHSFPDQRVRVKVVHLPSGTFGEATGQPWEQWSLIQRARTELAAKLSGGEGPARVPAKIPPGPNGPHELAAEVEPAQEDR